MHPPKTLAGKLYLVALAITLITLAPLISGCTASGINHTSEPKLTMSGSVLAVYNEGAAHFQNKDFEKAIERYRAALDLARLEQDEAGAGLSLAAIGAAHLLLKEYKQALESLTVALPYLKKSQNLAAEGLTLGTIGQVYASMGNFVGAIEEFDRALAIGEIVHLKASELEKLVILALRAEVFFQKADAHDKLAQFTEAVNNYSNAALDYQTVGKLDEAGVALRAAAYVSQRTKKWRDAAKFYAEASAIFDRVGKIADATSATVMVGQAFGELYEYDQALAQYQRALDLLGRSPSKVNEMLEAGILREKGKLHRLLGQYQEAIESFHAARLKYQQAGESKLEADVLTELAEVWFWLAEHKTATEYYKHALELYKALGDVNKQIQVLAMLAEASWLGGGTLRNQTVEYAMAGVKLGHLEAKKLAVEPLTLLLKLKDRYSPSQEEILREHENTRKNQPEAAPEDVTAFATFLIHLGISQKVTQALRSEGIALSAEYIAAAGSFNQKIGRIILEGGKTEAGINYLSAASIYHMALPFNRETIIDWAKDWYFLGEAYRKKRDFATALDYFRLVAVLADLLRTPEIHWAYGGLAETYAEMGDMEKAIYYYRRGLAVLESVHTQQDLEAFKIGVFEGALYRYRNFVLLLLDLYRKSGRAVFLREAFHYAERQKARAFLDIMERSRTGRLGGELDRLTAEQKDLYFQMARLHQRLRTTDLDLNSITRLLGELRDLRDKWVVSRRGFEEKRIKGIFHSPASVEQVQAALDTDSVLLEYFIGRDGLALWAITKEKIESYSLRLKEVEPILTNYLKTLREPLIGSDELANHVALGKRLFQLLLGPAENQIRGKTHLLVVPDGPLHYLPFEALITSEFAEAEQQRGRPIEIPYVLKKFRVSYIPSASVFVSQNAEQSGRENTPRLPLVAFGDPVYEKATSSAKREDVQAGLISNLKLRGLNLGRLEFSGEEVRRIAQVWGISSNSEHINLRKQATAKRVRELDLSRYRTVHFAVHAVLGDEVRGASQPALVLSQDVNGQNGYGLLELSDVAELKLNADLAVLSACNTGMGQLYEGEGVMSLTRAFLVAGASSVVVSLWMVEDQSTGLLMERFYQRLKQGESRAEALRQAKLDLLRTTIDLKAIGMQQSLAAPFYWAPFVLVGDWGPILGK